MILMLCWLNLGLRMSLSAVAPAISVCIFRNFSTQHVQTAFVDLYYWLSPNWNLSLFLGSTFLEQYGLRSIVRDTFVVRTFEKDKYRIALRRSQVLLSSTKQQSDL
jgi:hypothetical protein